MEKSNKKILLEILSELECQLGNVDIYMDDIREKMNIEKSKWGIYLKLLYEEKLITFPNNSIPEELSGKELYITLKGIDYLEDNWHNRLARNYYVEKEMKKLENENIRQENVIVNMQRQIGLLNKKIEQ
ncbi:MAG: hypothetical protein ACOCQR_00075 [bacterium]